MVAEARTVGITACVELSADARAANPSAADAMVGAARRDGVADIRVVGLEF
jgi:hypothetical protein